MSFPSKLFAVLRGESDTPAVTDAPALIGRAQELAQLSAALDRAEAGEAPIVWVEGDREIGKTALLSTFAWVAAEQRRRLRIFHLRAPNEGAYQPVAEAAYAATNKRVWERLGGKRRTTEMARSLLPDWIGAIPGIGELASAIVATVDALQRRRKRDVPALADEDSGALLKMSRRRALVLLLDDLERADVAALSTLDALARAAAGSRMLIVGAYRPTAAGAPDPPVRALARSLSADRCTTIRLGPLARPDVGEWLQQRFPGANIPDAFAGWFADETGGHPGAVHATAAHLVETGAVRFDADEWSFETDAAQLDSPAIEESFADLSAINPYIAEVVQAASVLGDKFDALTLSRLLDRDELAVEDQLALGIHYGVLERIGEIELPDDELTTSYRFVASHVRSALLRGLPTEQRRTLEQRRAPSAAGS